MSRELMTDHDAIQEHCAARLADIADAMIGEYVDAHPGHWMVDPNAPGVFAWWQDDAGRVMIVLYADAGDVECHDDIATWTP